MIRFDNVSKIYPNKYEALRNVSFHMKSGEMAFLTGHSGAGKSTLLKLIMAMESCSRGNIIIRGRRLAKLSRRQIAEHRRRIGMIFQTPCFLNNRTVFENVALPLTVSGYHHLDRARRVRAALDKVGLLHKEKYYPENLSTGEQQRVGIARACVNRPKILLADEPTGNLDPDLSREIMLLLAEFNQVGVTVLIASHDVDLISRMSYRIMRIEHGRFEAEGVMA